MPRFVLLMSLGLAGCAPREVLVDVVVWDMVRGCIAYYDVMRPAEYWPEDGWTCNFPPGEAVDPNGLCVGTQGTTCRNSEGELTMWDADPYFRPCAEAPECCGSMEASFPDDGPWCEEIPRP